MTRITSTSNIYSTNSILESAKQWALWGATTFPCRSAGVSKSPLVQGWRNRLYKTPQEIEDENEFRYSPKYGYPNIGVLCGCKQFGDEDGNILVCIEIDNEDAAKAFLNAFPEQCQKTRIEISANKRLPHIFLWTPPPVPFGMFHWNGEHGGEIRSRENTIIAPSIDPITKNKYETLNNVPPATFKSIKSVIDFFFSDKEKENLIKFSGKKKKNVFDNQPQTRYNASTRIEAIRRKFPTSIDVFDAFGLKGDREACGDQIRIKGYGGLLCEADGYGWFQHGNNWGGDQIDALAFVLYGRPVDKKNKEEFNFICSLLLEKTLE